jgi:hypothetical protein
MILPGPAAPRLDAILKCLPVILAFCALASCKHNMRLLEQNSVPIGSGPHYAQSFGQHYRTKVALYLFTLNEDLDYKYVGRNDGSCPYLAAILPDSVSRANVGRAFGAAFILDVVPAGSEFTIAAETHEITDWSGIRDKGGIPMGFICRLTYDGKQVSDALSEFIQSAQVAPAGIPNQGIDPAIATKTEP